MGRPIAIAVAVTTSFTVWFSMAAARGKDPASRALQRPVYVVWSNSYLPVQTLSPAY